MVSGGRDVEREFSWAGVAGLSSQRVANCLELGNGEERGDHVELDQLVLLLIGEGVERARLEAREGVVGRGKNGHCVAGVVELVIDLVAHLGGAKEAEEDGELTGFFEDFGDVWGAGRDRWGSRSLG